MKRLSQPATHVGIASAGSKANCSGGSRKKLFPFLITASLLFSLQGTAQTEQISPSDLDKIEKSVQVLDKKVQLHTRVLDGVSEQVSQMNRSLATAQVEADKAKDERAELTEALGSLRSEMSKLRNDIAAATKETQSLIAEQESLRSSVEASANKVNGAIIITIVSAIFAIIVAVVSARGIVKRNRINWYSLVRDTLSKNEAA